MSKRLLKREKVALLERLPLFEKCSQRELSALADITIESTRTAGSFLTWEGREGGLMFVIVDGEAEVLTGDDLRGFTPIGRLGPGDVIGELSLIDGQARSASVRAITDIQLLQITSDDFRQLLDSSPQFVRNLLRALSLKVRTMEALTS